MDWATFEDTYAAIDVSVTAASKRCSFDHRTIRWPFKRKFPYLYIENKPISLGFMSIFAFCCRDTGQIRFKVLIYTGQLRFISSTFADATYRSYAVGWV
ncbi:hypothetical protein [Rhizobium sp. 11515TR]|uniref:hypothetical protein n=1 Tax=unclassified Rhizobium TaxID=2613769 RepID=UPI0011B69F1D|nr:hypothetical protein [Rhizobium sp. 11515TR]